MDLSIMIPHFNRKELLERCLPSIPAGAGGETLSYETIVVDNGSKDGSPEMIKERFPHCILLQNETNEGFSRATNRGLRIAQGDYLLCMNNDTVLSPGSLEILISFMKEHPSAGVAGGKIFNRDGTVQLSARSFPRLETAFFNRSSLLSRLLPQNPFSRRYLLTDWDHHAVREVDWVSGSFFLIRRELLQKIGFFDERFFLYCEDVDYCRRVRDAGYQVFYVPEAQTLHDTSYSEKKVETLFFHHQSMYRFYKKYEARGPFWDMIILGGISFRFLSGICLLTTRKLFLRRENGSPS